MSEDEVSRWLDGLAAGDEEAIGEIWRQYYDRLVRLSRKKLAEGSRRMADEEDIALSAFHSFCKGAADGRFPQLEDRYDLWKLLITITARKAGRHVRRSKRQKRGQGKVRGESVFQGSPERQNRAGIGIVMGQEPTPQVAALAAEECGRLLALLPDDTYRSIAQWKLEGYTNEEIAKSLQCAPRTVERKLNKIRELWSASDGD